MCSWSLFEAGSLSLRRCRGACGAAAAEHAFLLVGVFVCVFLLAEFVFAFVFVVARRGGFAEPAALPRWLPLGGRLARPFARPAFLYLFLFI